MKYIFLALKKAILVAGDIVIWFIALSFALLIRFQGEYSKIIWHRNFTYFFYLLLLWLVIFVVFDLYNIRKIHDKIKYFSSFFQCLVLSTIISVIIFYLSTFKFGFTPKTILLFHILIFCALFIGFRLLFLKILKKSQWRKNLCFVGFTKETQEIIDEVLANAKDLKIAIIFNLNNDFDCENFCGKNNIKNYHQKSFENFNKILKENFIDEIVVVPDGLDRATRNNLFGSLVLGLDIVTLNDFYENIFRKVHLNEISQLWFINKIHEGSKKFYEFVKRLIDILLSIILIVIFIITFPIIFLIIKFESKGPVFFTQVRTKKFGEEFRLIKYRTMVENAEKGVALWAQKNDKRITKVGKFLRKTRIDELPQCINILRGEMSFVGPRPERPEFILDLEKQIPFYRQRLLIKPGLTGWAQINYPYAASIDDSWKKLQYDLYYLKNRSIILDLVIILRTIEVILLTRGQ